MYDELMEGIEVSEDVLEGFKVYVLEWLSDCKYFSNVEVDITSDKESLINASLNYQGDISEEWVANELRRIWENRLRFNFLEEHSCSIQEGVITFHFFTRTQQHSYTGEMAAVTGRITAYP